MFVREEVRLCFESCAGVFLKLLAKEEQRDESIMTASIIRSCFFPRVCLLNFAVFPFTSKQ